MTRDEVGTEARFIQGKDYCRQSADRMCTKGDSTSIKTNDWSVEWVTQLLTSLQPCFKQGKELNSNGEIRVTAIDIKARFDQVWHQGTQAKLESMEIMGETIHWDPRIFLARVSTFSNGKLDNDIYIGQEGHHRDM
eukprot:g41801.t1